MSNIQALTSLAILKTNYDNKVGDYTEYIVSFVSYVIGVNNLSPIIINDVAELLTVEFGLKIPIYVIEKAINRLAKSGLCEKRKPSIFHQKRNSNK